MNATDPNPEKSPPMKEPGSPDPKIKDPKKKHPPMEDPSSKEPPIKEPPSKKPEIKEPEVKKERSQNNLQYGVAMFRYTCLAIFAISLFISTSSRAQEPPEELPFQAANAPEVPSGCIRDAMQLDYSFAFLPTVTSGFDVTPLTEKLDAMVEDILRSARQYTFIFPRMVYSRYKRKEPGIPPCREIQCLPSAQRITGATNVVLFTVESHGGLIIAIHYAIYHKSGRVEQDTVPVSAFRSNYAAMVTVLEQMTSFISTGETLIFEGQEPLKTELGKGFRTSEELRKELAQELELARLQAEKQKAEAPTKTKYPILGPAILGAAGITLTSLGIVSATKGKCDLKNPQTGECASGIRVEPAEVAGYGIAGGAALAGAAFWFVFGAEEVPIEVEATDKTATIKFQGKF